MNKLVQSTLLASTMFYIIQSAPAYAQADGSTADVQSDAIVVTARRVNERLQDVPISISVLDSGQIKDRNIVSAIDLATYTPSLTSNSRFGPDKSSFVIRGFTQESTTAPSVGVYFADVPVLRSGAATASGNGAGPGAFFDLQNVQVLKGPQGTLFGRNTTGGAILLVPQKPTDRLEGYVEGTIGSYDLRRVQAVLNLPLAEGLNVRLGADRNVRDGYEINHSGIGPDRLGNLRYTALRLSIVGDLTPDLQNYTVASYSRSNTYGTLPRLIACLRDPAARRGGQLLTAGQACTQIDRQNARGDGFRDVESSNLDPHLQLEQWQVINTTTWQASDTLTVKNIAAYGEFRENTSINIYGDNFAPFQLIQLNAAPGYDTASQSTFTEELQFQGKTSDGKLNWQAGGFMEMSDPLGTSSSFSQVFLNCQNIATFQCTDPLSAGSVIAPYTQTKYHNQALYAQASYNLSEHLSLTGGFRYTWDQTSTEAQNIQYRFTAPGTVTAFCNNTVRIRNPDGSFPVVATSSDRCSLVFSETSQRPTWLIGLDYKPSRDLLLYAKYVRGYRPGGVNGANFGLERWGPETVDVYEAGFKASFAGAVRGHINVSAFYNNFRDQQLAASLSAKPGTGVAGGSAIVNAGKSRIYGLEADGSLEPIKGLKFDVGYAYLNTKLQEISVPAIDPSSPYLTPVPTAQVGGNLVYSPKHRVSLTGTYALPLDESVGHVSLGATYVYTSRQISSADSPYGTIPATELLNFNVNWDNVLGQPFDLALFMTNVTNTEFPLSVSNGWRSFGFESALPNEPRMYGVRLRYRFGKN